MNENPIRVCFVVSHFHPFQSGAERQALEQGAELVRIGHLVQVVTKYEPSLPRDDVVRGVQVRRWVRTSPRGPLFGLTFVAGVFHALRRLRASYDLVHTHQGLWEAIATGLARPWLKGAPTLVQPASSGYYGEAQELTRTKGFPILRRLILRNTAFAAISADIEREWLALGVPAARLSRMASGVDTRRFHPGPSEVEAELPPRPRVLFTGRLHPQKNLDVLLDAWSDLTQQVQANLLLVGDGPDRDRLRQRTRALGIAGQVHFLGAVPDPASYLRAADVFVLPSVAEGMSNSLLEAMATGLPCVASSIGGNVDLIDENQTGLLIRPDRPENWTAALRRILGDPDLGRRLGVAAKQRIEKEFALNIIAGRYVALYRQLLANARLDGKIRRFQGSPRS